MKFKCEVATRCSIIYRCVAKDIYFDKLLFISVMGYELVLNFFSNIIRLMVSQSYEWSLVSSSSEKTQKNWIINVFIIEGIVVGGKKSLKVFYIDSRFKSTIEKLVIVSLNLLKSVYFLVFVFITYKTCAFVRKSGTHHFVINGWDVKFLATFIADNRNVYFLKNTRKSEIWKKKIMMLLEPYFEEEELKIIMLYILYWLIVEPLVEIANEGYCSVFVL